MKTYPVTTTTSDGLTSNKVLTMPELGDQCSKCHESPSTHEVMIMIERPGGVTYLCDKCAAPPAWTKNLPKEVGWYWVRSLSHPKDKPWPEEFLLDDQTYYGGCEWWPVRITEPPEEK